LTNGEKATKTSHKLFIVFAKNRVFIALV